MAQAHPSFAGRCRSMSPSPSPRHRPSQSLAPRKANEINKLARFYETALILRKKWGQIKVIHRLSTGYPQTRMTVYDIILHHPN